MTLDEAITLTGGRIEGNDLVVDTDAGVLGIPLNTIYYGDGAVRDKRLNEMAAKAKPKKTGKKD